MKAAAIRPALKTVAYIRRLFQTSELWFIVLAGVIGAIAGLSVAGLSHLAEYMHQKLYGLSAHQLLSATAQLPFITLLALPIGGLILGFVRMVMPKRARPPIDVVEANALYGGRIPLRDTFVVSLQTLISNGFGASVGLEAAFAQLGGGGASRLGQWFNLRRSSLRTLVGAGAGSAIGAAFGAPLAGAFYAFEIVLGGYTPASLAPVAVASLSAVVTAHMAGLEPFVVVSTLNNDLRLVDYGFYTILGLMCAMIGITIVRLVAISEQQVKRLPLDENLRPFVGGLILMGLAVWSPQILSGGHGAMHLHLSQQMGLLALALIFTLKLSASLVSLGFGFRGGLFFASLFLGSLLGNMFALSVNAFAFFPSLDTTNATLVGMAALAVSIVGGPMTMSLLVLEVTHDFALTAAVVTACLCANALVRARFGYSFSTWRLHLRGEAIRNARDIGWVKTVRADMLMRPPPVIKDSEIDLFDLRAKVALGSTSRIVLVDHNGRYKGIVPTADAYIDGLDLSIKAQFLAIQPSLVARPDMDILELIQLFDEHSADDLAVVDAKGKLIGMLSEKYVRRRYVEELEKSQREFFGE